MCDVLKCFTCFSPVYTRCAGHYYSVSDFSPILLIVLLLRSNTCVIFRGQVNSLFQDALTWGCSKERPLFCCHLNLFAVYCCNKGGGDGVPLFDTDESGTAEFDILGAEYAALLNKCFEYCSVLSFFIRNADVSLPAKLEAYRIPVTPTIARSYERYRDFGVVHAYQLSPQNKHIILAITDSMFSWIDGWGHHNPEDPIFYRADSSIFLSANVHEGHLILSPRDEEDVNSIINHPNWIKRSVT